MRESSSVRPEPSSNFHAKRTSDILPKQRPQRSVKVPTQRVGNSTDRRQTPRPIAPPLAPTPASQRSVQTRLGHRRATSVDIPQQLELVRDHNRGLGALSKRKLSISEHSVRFLDALRLGFGQTDRVEPRRALG